MNIQKISSNENIPVLNTSKHIPFIVHSDQMKSVLKLAEKVAKVPSTVLIIGDSGVGKELVANYIYQFSNRKGKPFIKINCGAIPESLIESELFGYKKGAFTGADANGKTGYFLQANQGIIFLDEITELPLNMQVKLLRVLQEREVTPIGATLPIPIDVQIIAATNKNLLELVKEDCFREDLYYRLNVVNIDIPPLRERVDDIPYLVYYFLKTFNNLYHKEVEITNEAIELLKNYPWYGNVREIKNLIERIVVTSDNLIIKIENINLYLKQNIENETYAISISNIMPLQEASDYVEEKLVTMAIEKYKSINLAAKALGLTQPTMSRKYQKVRERIEQKRLKSFNKKSALENELDNRLRSVASVIASAINIDKIKKLKKNLSLENPVYHELQKRLSNIRMSEGKIVWSFIWIVDSNNRVINLVTDENLKILPGEEYTGPPEIIGAVYDGIKGNIVVTQKYTDKFGHWKTSIAPIIDEHQKVIAIVGVDFSVEYIDQQMKL